jgi:hypothetical protein
METKFSNKDNFDGTINDFPVYEMVCGWSTHEKLACPYCMKNNKNFTLINDGKTFFFFIVIRGSCLVIIDTKKTKKTFQKVKLKGMLHL